MKKILALTALTTMLIIFGGCASIVDGGDKSVSIRTNPAGAKVNITNQKGEFIFTEITPTIVSLKRNQDYKLTFELAGYYSAEAHVNSVLDGWYLGNIFLGGFGVLGILIVDPASGDMWTLEPREVSWNLVPNTGPLTPEQLKAAELKFNPPPVILPSRNVHVAQPGYVPR